MHIYIYMHMYMYTYRKYMSNYMSNLQRQTHTTCIKYNVSASNAEIAVVFVCVMVHV